ncbi:MAG TPA: SDR family oxidoreductase [Candidatus Limnocylindria bacterium]|nr:SDR family oxidoreductase [Candidatus Limnocylindria bacterium]
MDLGLKGKVCCVTGGSRGIGFAAAKAFLAEGAKVAICARERDALLEAEGQLRRFGEIAAFEADATHPEGMDAFAAFAAGRFGGIDCWVNNVGATVPRKGGAWTPEELRLTEALCFDSVLWGCQAARPYLRERGGGAIVNVSSLAARCGTAGRSTLYGPLKAAVNQLSIMLAAEYAADGIRVNAVLPGFTLTPAARATIPEAELARNARGTLLGRLARPEEIAAPIVFLCSPQASYVTAASLEVSGGRAAVLNPEIAHQHTGTHTTPRTEGFL